MTEQHSIGLPPFSKPIPTADGYLADLGGTIWSRRRIGGIPEQPRMVEDWHPLKGWTTRYGYQQVLIVTPVGRFKKFVHVLVLETFVGPRPPGMDACHANGIRTDNRLANLRWGTRKENMRDAIKHGTTNRGERNPFVKLNAEQVIEIREMLDRRIPQSAIAKQFGISQQTVSNIKMRTWQHLL